jgi:CDP-diacylglycerol--glycerol-3-phosphate 3-phosphatidyltransferase
MNAAMIKSTNELRTKFLNGYYAFIGIVIRPLIRTGISPNTISFLSIALSLFAGFLYAVGHIFQAGLFLLVSGFMDTLDGTVARLTNQSSRFGALLDSTLDRYAEFFILSGILFFYRQSWMFFVVLLAIIGSIMVSYIKARAQSLGPVRTVGLMQRPERFLLLLAGSFLNQPAESLFPNYPHAAFSASLMLLALLSNITAIRRLVEGRKDLTKGV